MPNVKKKWISIMIIPEDGTGVRKWRITSKLFTWFKISFFASAVFVIVGLASMIGMIVLYGKLNEYKHYNDMLREATAKLDTIESRLLQYEQRERRLRTVLGSDFQLPVSMNVENETPDSRLTLSNASTGSDEFGRLIKSQEDRLRLIPSIWPVNAWQISKDFKNTGNPRLDHYGIDILAPKNSSVFSTADGRVIFAGYDRDLGQLVVISHNESGWVTKYGHNESLLVREGEFVVKGQTIAVFGGKDNSGTGSHLHYAMFFKGKPENPLDRLPDRPGLKIALQYNQ